MSIGFGALGPLSANVCRQDLRALFNASQFSAQPDSALAVVVVIKRPEDNKVLLLKRKSGFWSFMGGHYEASDTSITDCANREAFEEIGVGLKNFKFLRDHFIFVEEKKRPYFVAVLSAEIDQGIPSIQEPHKNTDLRWVAWNQLPENLFPPNRALINDGLNPYR